MTFSQLDSTKRLWAAKTAKKRYLFWVNGATSNALLNQKYFAYASSELNSTGVWGDRELERRLDLVYDLADNTVAYWD